MTFLRADGCPIDLVLDVRSPLRQFRNLVLVVPHANTQLPLPVLQGNHLDGSIDVEAIVLQLSAVCPVLVQTAEES